MTGNYDKPSKSIRWTTHAKDPNGRPMVQQSVATHENEDVRVLVLSVPGEQEGDFTKFMQIRFVKRK